MMSSSLAGGSSGRGQQQLLPPGLSEEQARELREVFQLFDVGQRKCIDARELRAALRALGFDVRREHVVAMLLDVGKSVTDLVTLEEFCAMLAGRLPDKSSREEVRKLFRLFDEDGSGRIGFRHLKKVAAEVGENLTDDELQEMVDEADRDGDGFVTFDDFYRIMRYRANPLDDDDDEDEGEDDDDGGGDGGGYAAAAGRGRPPHSGREGRSRRDENFDPEPGAANRRARANAAGGGGGAAFGKLGPGAAAAAAAGGGGGTGGGAGSQHLLSMPLPAGKDVGYA